MYNEQTSHQFKALNPIMPEGIPGDSIIAVIGSPGAGKTILCSQIMFELEEDAVPIWFSTFSETQSRLQYHLGKFSFFDQKKVGHPIQIIDLASIFQKEQNLESVLETIENEIKKANANVVFIDSFKQILQWLEISKTGFRPIASLPLFFAFRNITVFLLGEFELEDISRESIFGMVDGIIRVSFEKENYARNRYIEVLKMRGAPFLSGLHPARIDLNGFNIFAHQVSSDPYISFTEKISSGIEGLDTMLYGGFLKGSMVVVSGPSGTGKSVSGAHFLSEGIKNNEYVLYYNLEEERSQVFRNTLSIGFDFEKAEKDGFLTIAAPQYADASFEEIVSHIQALCKKKQYSRIFFDSLSKLLVDGLTPRFQHFLNTLYELFKREGITAFCAVQPNELVETASASGMGVSSVIDAIIILKFIEIDGELHRALAVLKVRGSGHDKKLREYVITSKGFRTTMGLGGYSGMLTGTTRQISQTSEEQLHKIFNDLLGPAGDKIFQQIKDKGFLPKDITEFIKKLGTRGVILKASAEEYIEKVDNLLGK